MIGVKSRTFPASLAINAFLKLSAEVLGEIWKERNPSTCQALLSAKSIPALEQASTTPARKHRVLRDRQVSLHRLATGRVWVMRMFSGRTGSLLLASTDRLRWKQCMISHNVPGSKK